MLMPSRASTILILSIIAGLLAPASADAQFSGFPDVGFVDDSVVSPADLRLSSSDQPRPTSIAWLPNGNLLIITQQGGLFRDDGANVVKLLDLSQGICSFANGFGNEMGLLGLAVDPDFSVNGNLYLYATDRKGTNLCANQVAKYRLAGNQAELVDILIDNIRAPGNHNGGDLQFGNDGLLYISVGDGGTDFRTGEPQDTNGNARRLDLLNGKILRITANGGIPAGNPFQGTGTARCNSTGQLEQQSQRVGAEKKSRKQKRRAKKRQRRQRRDRVPATKCREIFATGLRNPYRIAFDPDAGNRFYINDVGGSGFEEIDEGSRGVDYGWNVREGPCPVGDIRPNCPQDGRFGSPIFAYRRDGAPPFDGCRTITGGAFVPNAAMWPELGAAYLFADLYCGRIFALEGQGASSSIEVFASGESASHLAFGPDGALYYTAIFAGEVHRIVYEP